jgi:glycosyltransferase involved in cell wall biosynthesis
MKRWQARRKRPAVPAAVASYLLDLKNNEQRLRPDEPLPKQAKTVGIFLGCFSNPPTPQMVHLLAQWEMIILDPFQAGTLDILQSECTSNHVLGRLDISMIVKAHSSESSEEILRSVQATSQALFKSFKHPHQTQSPFTGVVLANWQAHFPPAVLNALADYIHTLRLTVYLELAPPEFLGKEQARSINMRLYDGIVCRNGTILPDGDRRDYFGMTPLRTAQRALAAQPCPRGSTVIMWETVKDDVELSHSVVKRHFNWCRFNSVISWIGPEAALTSDFAATAKTVAGEPLGALMWLKDERTVKAHDIWRHNDQVCQALLDNHDSHVTYDSLASFVPNLKARLALSAPKTRNQTTDQDHNNYAISSAPRFPYPEHDPFSFSASGRDFTGLGCFQLGLECASQDFADLVEQQQRLRELKFLKPVDLDVLRVFAAQLQALYDSRQWTLYTTFDAPISSARLSQAIKELCGFIADKDDDRRLEVLVGLQSGFRTNPETQFWGLYDVDGFGHTTIYVSAKTCDLPSTILHTFFSSRNCTRAQCFQVEMMLCEQTLSLTPKWTLPARFVQDIEQLSSSENIFLLQRLASYKGTEFSILAARLRAVCEYQLLEIPSLAQLRALNSSAYLQGEISADDLVTSRIDWYIEKGCHHPELSTAISLFKDIDHRMQELLMGREVQLLSQILVVLEIVLQKDAIDASADLFALAVFCACRKLALSEIYLEVLDRNPLPNPHSDQAACYAEMFATGSRCDSYFDVTPNVLGKILSDRQQSYYKLHQPPTRNDAITELPTSYASMLADTDPDPDTDEVAIYYSVAFLGIFAVPALIDIILLTTIGRGLYLTAFMTETERDMATIALMVSLFLCGGIGTWISSGASYYLHSMAFPAMNMFVLTRFVAGVAVCLASGTVAFLIIASAKSIYAAVIFLLYFVMLSTYFTLLATLATYQLPGFMFQSGRIVIMRCIPILFISPILTLWVGHDILIYLCVLAGFLTCLLLGARNILTQWSSWYLKIPCVTDEEVINWYIESRPLAYPNGSPQSDETDLGTSLLPRKALLEAVLEERNRHFWKKPTNDKFVKRLADQLAATKLLMNWYCKYTRATMPVMFSVTWNLQCNAGIDTLKEIQKGLKLHNAFLHWRHAGDEVWCGVLYFAVALMDKWAALISGGNIVGLSAADSPIYRLAVGFGLASYLVSAIFLDGIAQPLWATANKKASRPISSLPQLKQVYLEDATARRRLYWTTLFKFFLMHTYGVALTAALMWTLEGSRRAVIMYLAYMGAYIGLLWYQYNRIFTGAHAFYDLILGASLGLPIGVLLRHSYPNFDFGDVIGLGVATWTVAVLSIWTSRVGWPNFNNHISDKGTVQVAVFHYDDYPGCGINPSQEALSELYASVSALPSELHNRISATGYPGVQITKILKGGNIERQPELVKEAIKSADDILLRTGQLWTDGDITVDLVSPMSLPQRWEQMRSVSRAVGDELHIFVFINPDVTGPEWISDTGRNCQIVGEILLQATSESKCGISHDHSTLAKLLAVSQNTAEEFHLPESTKLQLERSAIARAEVIKSGNKILLRQILLGLDCDTVWEDLPHDIRSALLKRCCGEACNMSPGQLTRLQSRLFRENPVDNHQWIARSNLGAKITILAKSYAELLSSDHVPTNAPHGFNYTFDHFIASPPVLDMTTPQGTFIHRLKLRSTRIGQTLNVCTKFLMVMLVADPEFQRELNYLMSSKSWFIRSSLPYVLNSIWLFCHFLQTHILPLVLLHGNEEVSKLYRRMKGVTTTIESYRIIVEGLNGPSTCFLTAQPDGKQQLHEYSGILHQKPIDPRSLKAINTYNGNLALIRREEYFNGSLTGVFAYEHEHSGNGHGRMQPIQRQCLQGRFDKQLVHYDDRGYITSGSYLKNENLVNFRFFYRNNARFDDELLRAEFFLAHITIKVSWCVKPWSKAEKLDHWIPSSRVMEATFIEGSNIYHSRWTYEHRSHPVIKTTLNGLPADTPPMIRYDWFKVLSKPEKCSFLADDPLLLFDSMKTNFVWRMLGLNVRTHRISTSIARTCLWEAWKKSKNLDAPTVRWLDELALRSDKTLKPYWRARDWGHFNAATSYLDAQCDAVMARTDINPDISSWTLLAYKMSDLYSFGQGGDATINTRTQMSQMPDEDDVLHVLAMDTGTWPNEGGGVSACRRDMVNDLESIRWHVLAENANDFGLPKFQVERNVQSLTVLPLWGMDFLTPSHGVFENYLDAAVQRRSHTTTAEDIEKNFFPILTTLVLCSRALKLTRGHLDDATQALVALNAYFEYSRHWSDVWMSDVVKEKWRELWLIEDMENTRPISEWLQAEHPSLAHLDQALDMWQRYLFIFSVPVPQKIPDVFQASHHFTGASYGVLCKVLRNCTLHVWDHCISWREVTVFLSSAMSFDPPFVCTSLISISKLACTLILTHADVVLPCADFFNPGWEIELGTLEGTLGHRRVFHRKIDPVVNGITNMGRFKPVEKINSVKPTVSMLSHVRFVKDIKNAILAADIIVNEWHFSDYRLEIYGDMIKAPAYSVECQEIIATKGLGKHVLLKGLGSPATVLADAWIFLNCSVSEGLPLAMGEAALSGVPVVCTDVGASFRVVTDLATGERFSAVVAPNDSLSLAQAQIKVLALLDEWSAFDGDTAEQRSGYLTTLPLEPTRDQAAQITRRMYEYNEQRRKLGMMGRANVLSSFDSERYLREHEQMLWIGKYRSPSWKHKASRSVSDKMSSRDGKSSRGLITREKRITELT